MTHETSNLTILMYHGIRRSPADELPAGWSRTHAVDAAAFARQMDDIVAGGRGTLNPADLDRHHVPGRSLLITFDDGHRSDSLVAAPALQRRGLTAAFFITWSYLGRPGYLDRNQVRELRAASFEIGSHGLSHKKLTEVGPAELWREALDSKRRLEDLIGEPVANFAIPSGAYNDLVLQTLWAAGYKRIMTSDFGVADMRHSVMHRMGVTAQTTPRRFRALLSAGPLSASGHRILMGMKRRLGQGARRVRTAAVAVPAVLSRRA